MFDLIAKNLSPEQQAARTRFIDYTSSNSVRCGAAIDETERLRNALGDKICTFSNLEWNAIVVMAYNAACDLYEMAKKAKVNERPKCDVTRENMAGLKVMISSIKKNQSGWLMNNRFEVNSKSALGLISTVSSLAASANGEFFDELLDCVQKEILPPVVKDWAERAGFPLNEVTYEPMTKENVLNAMYRLIRFVSRNASGFSIC